MSATEELQPINISLAELLRLIMMSYNNPLEHGQYLQLKYGNAVMVKFGRFKYVHLFGPDANRLMLLNQGNVFSSKKAWDHIIGRIIPNGLMLRDGEDHRSHRRIMQEGFKHEALQRYCLAMAPQIQQSIGQWQHRESTKLCAYPMFKSMTLELAATVFLGMPLGENHSKFSQAFNTTVAASMPRVPIPFPGNLLWRGIRARKILCELFLAQVSTKRVNVGTDMFSLLCKAHDEQGKQYTDQEIVDHIIFLMIAAHDTTTSTLTSMTYVLAKYPQWQERLYREFQSLNVDRLEYTQLSELTETNWVIKEVLRMYPPLSTLPRYSLRAFDFEGKRIPADVLVATYPIHTHYQAEYWRHPQTFDPLRFSDERAEHKQHPYSWAPFGGGAHMCIGLHFAQMQIKLVIFEMLKNYRWSVADDYSMPVQQSPISKPRDGLPITIYSRV